jgi:hypothetical protein
MPEPASARGHHNYCFTIVTFLVSWFRVATGFIGLPWCALTAAGSSFRVTCGFSGETRTHPDPPTATHAGETSHPRLHLPGFGSPAGFSRQANMQTQLLQYFNYMHVHAHLHTSKQANIHNHKTFDIVQYFDNRHSSMLGILRPGHNVGAVGARVMRFRILGGSWAGE